MSVPRIVKQAVVGALAIASGVASAADVAIRANTVISASANPAQIVTTNTDLWFTDSQNHSVIRASVLADTIALTNAYPIAPAMPSGLQPGDLPAITYDAFRSKILFTWEDSNNATAGVGEIGTDGSALKLTVVPGEHYAGTSIAAGPDHNTWYTSFGQRAIFRLTSDGTATKFNIPAGYSGAGHIIATPSEMWISLSGFIDTHAGIGKVATDGTITDHPIDSVEDAIGGIARSASGVIYSNKTANTVAELFDDGTITQSPISIPNAKPAGVTIGPDRKAFVALAGAYQIVWFTPDIKPPQLNLQPFNGAGTGKDLVLFPEPGLTPNSFRLIGNYSRPLGGLCLTLFNVTDTSPQLPADLAITKMHSADEEDTLFGPERTITYTIVVTNVSDRDCIGGFKMTDQLPVELRKPFVSTLDGDVFFSAPGSKLLGNSSCDYDDFLHQLSCTMPELLPAHAQRWVDIGFLLDDSVPISTRIENSAFLTASCDGNAANNVSNVDAFQLNRGLLSVTKNHYVGGDGRLVWFVTVENIGDGPTAGPITISDPLPSGVSIDSVVVNPSGQDMSCGPSFDTVTCQSAATLDPGRYCEIAITTSRLPPSSRVVNVVTASDGTFSATGQDVIYTDAQGKQTKTGPVPVDSPPVQPGSGRH